MSTISEPIAQAASSEMQLVESGSLVVYEGQKVVFDIVTFPDKKFKIIFKQE